MRGAVPMEAAAAVILKAIEGLRPGRERVIVAIDGRCASGKTTLAARLQSACGCDVVHMDHFFLPPARREPGRPGGNIDLARLLHQVLLPLRGGEAPSYRPFDCAAQRPAGPVRLTGAPVAVVEGCYSCHPALRGCYDLTAFLSVGPELQRERVLLREGARRARAFTETWIPLEEAYFTACRVEQACRLRFAQAP